MSGKHGGARPGAGRPKGSRDAVTKEHQSTIAELARAHGPMALQTLVNIARSEASSEGARVAAANAILDRAYGKPLQGVDLTGSVGLIVTLESDAERL